MQTTGDTGHQCQWLQRPYTCRELCESRGGRPGLPIPNKPYGLCGRRATLNWTGLLVCYCHVPEAGSTLWGSLGRTEELLSRGGWSLPFWISLGRITAAAVGLGFLGHFPAGIVVCRQPIVDYGLVQHEWQTCFSAFRVLCVAVSTVLSSGPAVAASCHHTRDSSMVTFTVHAAPGVRHLLAALRLCRHGRTLSLFKILDVLLDWHMDSRYRPHYGCLRQMAGTSRCGRSGVLPGGRGELDDWLNWRQFRR